MDNFDTKKPAIPQIRLGNVLSGASMLNADEKGHNETFIGIIETASEQYRAYIKVLPPRQLINELVCSTLGRAVGLPIPEGFMVRASATELPDSRILADHKGQAIIFACADIGHPSLKRRITEHGKQFMRELFDTWKEWDSVAIFDEWIANGDRGEGNLIVESPRKVWLIDHGHALTSSNWKAADLVANKAVKNQIADLVFPELPLPKRMEIRTKAGNFAGIFGLVDAEEALHACHVNHLMNEQDFSALSSFITERVEKIFDLISMRLGIPNMGV